MLPAFLRLILKVIVFFSFTYFINNIEVHNIFSDLWHTMLGPLVWAIGAFVIVFCFPSVSTIKKHILGLSKP